MRLSRIEKKNSRRFMSFMNIFWQYKIQVYYFGRLIEGIDDEMEEKIEQIDEINMKRKSQAHKPA